MADAHRPSECIVLLRHSVLAEISEDPSHRISAFLSESTYIPFASMMVVVDFVKASECGISRGFREIHEPRTTIPKMLKGIYVECRAMMLRTWQVIRGYPETEKQLKELEELEHRGGVDFWKGPSSVGEPFDVMLSPQESTHVTAFLQRRAIPYEITMEDVGALIRTKSLQRVAPSSSSTTFSYNAYYKTSVLHAKLRDLGNRYRNVSEIVNLGYSIYRKEILGLAIATDSQASKMAIFIDGGIHGREFIAPATTIFLAEQLLSRQSDPTVKALLDNFNWYFVPLVNPDGYDHCHDNFRLWRKNLSKRSGLLSILCKGVDLNRNFNFSWGGRGSSKTPCDETYAGPSPFSEPESRAIGHFLLSKKPNVLAYITVHSYGQYFIFPWGHNGSKPANHDDLQRLGEIYVSAVQNQSGYIYRTGNAATTLYPASGTSEDWAKAEAGAKYAYTLELRDTGKYGFLLPASEIMPVGQENWAGLMAFATELTRRHPYVPQDKNEDPSTNEITEKPSVGTQGFFAKMIDLFLGLLGSIGGS
ncbi:unnamed protein product [Darwinula stevensoni]|uniref:Peptidase M14 domain-containing protein n=1 Tax=Darwinula stevensoni TaxID=69355 RepID=A0A7R8X361_9CRUS|nr:unnamed protein product [Darwinula stevensoni]CAG0884047.1 unnamed protein product [Darwinula stevensoni]